MRLVVALGLTACAAAPPPASRPDAVALAVVAEGPCARLSARAVGSTRVIVFGDTGYDLGAWTAGDRLSAAQTLVAISREGAFFDDALLRGVPVDGRGYAPFALEVGRTDVSWIRATTTRYAPHGTGKLFVQEARQLVERGDRFEPGPASAAVAPAARRAIARGFEGACAEAARTFVPIAYDATTEGFVVVVGQCERPGPQSDVTPQLRVAVAETGGAFVYRSLPGTERIEGHVDADVHVAGNEAWVVVSESFAAREGRRGYLARGTVAGFAEVDVGIDEGFLAVDGDASGTVFLAAGRALLALPAGDPARALRMTLPPLRTVRAQPELSVHDVNVLGDELWVEASYRVKVEEPGRPEPRSVWASALFGPAWGHAYFCDARREAAEAFVELENEP